MVSLACSALLVLTGCGPKHATLEIPVKPPHGMTELHRTSLPATPLRGYGKLAGEFASYESKAGGQCSLFVIQCEDEAKAGIVHAKYLSDLHLVLPVKDESLSVAGVTVPIVHVPDQGVIAAFRKGAQVCIAAATDTDHLTLALKTQSGSFDEAGFTATAKVPLYLDSLDRHGFSFYYYEGELPPAKPGEKQIERKNYKVLGEFDFAKKNGEAGFVFWQNEDKCDFAEGLSNDKLWEFGARACANRGLPVIVNSCVGDASWLLNRYRGDTQGKMPGYCGGYYCPGVASHAGTGHLGWVADEGLDAVLSVMQKTWRNYSQYPTTIEYLEPHGELRHGHHDILNEFGPQADKTFRAFLKETYGDLVSVSQRWHGKSDALRTWDDVHVPELVHFFGYSDTAYDLGGEWRFQYEEFKDGKAVPSNPAPDAWYLPATSDTEWPSVTAPQSDVQMFLPRRPAVWRRHFTLPSGWTGDKPKVWLYVFSLNRADRESAPVYLNGRKVAEPVIDGRMAPTVVEVSAALQPGENVLALRLPANFLGYRVYLTGKEPVQYPFLGEQLNAQWADFVRWQALIHQDTIRRSIEAIREVDPDRTIICMSPNAFISQVEELCQDYGGRFHDTGGMAGWWSEPGPMMMRAADMSYSAEPGNPAHSLPELKDFLGRWLTEGVNAIHYFIHVGDIYWNDELRPWFEQNQAIIGAFGKMHVPKAEVAMLYGDDVENLTGWPWNDGRSGYEACQFNAGMHKEYHMDGVSFKDFDRGFASAYRVIIDTNSRIMDEKTINDIETWIKQGGVFVTIGETGRHTPEKADSWPISRLTGYQVTQHRGSHELSFAVKQDVFKPEAWEKKALQSSGQELEPVAKDCVPLMLWPDGKTAIGMRRIGKGAIFNIGCNFNKPLLLPQILASLNIKRIPGYCDSEKVNSVHEVSNNGLYDIWILWNWEKKANTGNLVFRDGSKPLYCIDLTTHEKLSLTADGETARIASLSFGPGDIRILAAPRQKLTLAPLEWFKLQRGWWRGTKSPDRKVPTYEARFALDLNEQWRMKPLDDKDAADHSAMAAPALDDSAWTESRLGTWLVPEDIATHRLFFRKKFIVPAQWNHGELDLWLKAWAGNPVMEKARVWLDGSEILTSGIPQDLTAQLKAGTEHLLAVELTGEGQVIGFRGNMWLSYLLNPKAKLDLAGAWSSSPDALKWGNEITLPGPLEKLAMVKRRIKIDQPAGQTVMFWMEAPGLVDVIVNGHYVRRHHHRIGTRTNLNITPWIKFGEENEFVIPCTNGDPKIGIKAVELHFFEPGTYP